MSQPVASTKSKEVSPRGESGRDFTSVFHEYQRPIFNYLLRMTQNTDLAEDLTQETFVRVYRGLSNFRGGAKLSTWIYRIATNVSFDHFRSKSSRQENVTVSMDDIVADKTGIPNKDSAPPEQAVTQSEMSACVQRFIRDLPLNYRAVIILSDLQGLKNREIADVLDVSLDTVKIRLHRARKKLRAALNLGCDYYHDERNILVCEEKLEGEGKTK